MKTIRGKILFNMIGGMTTLALIIGLISSWFSMQSTVQSTERTLTQTVLVAASDVEANLRRFETIAFELGCMAALADPAVPVSDKKAMVEQKVSYYGFARGNIVDPNGISPIDGLNLSDREYFQQSMQGNTWISEPAVSKSTGEMVIMVSAPIWQNGNPNTNKVVGVVYFTQGVEFLNNIVKNIKIGDNGTTYMLNKAGVTIAHPNVAIVESRENSQELVKTDAKLQQLAALEAKMMAGETGFGAYSYNGVNKFLAYAPIDIPSKWSIAISVGKSEFLKFTNQSVVLLAIVSVALLLFFALVSARVAMHISTPITRVTKRLQLMAQGDLHTAVVVEHTGDETQILSECTKQTVERLTTYIDAIGMALGKISSGDLTVQKPDVEFAGDFVQLEQSVDGILAKLTQTMSGMQQNAVQVSMGSDQVAGSAQVLSQGAAEQASSIEELMSTLQEISSQIRQNADNAHLAQQETAATGQQVEISNRKMQDMIAAMQDISSRSGEISKIIKTIDDIAFQTNILALNAAVEAARAGAAGKGFAVVADEVRNLSGKSAEAAKNTTALIEKTLQAVENGTHIADDTAGTLAGVVTGARKVTSFIEQISDASARQANAMLQVSAGIEQISGVVQTNSATAEQSAAASEQLSGQANMLNELIGRFRLRQDRNDYLHSK